MKNKSLILLSSFFAGLTLLLTGCSPLVVQSPGGKLSPVNAISVNEDSHLMLFGYDMVSYFKSGKPTMGRSEFKSQYGDVTFWFENQDSKKEFDADPEKYIPQFGGYCANGIVYGIPWGGNADSWKIINGKLYIFGGKSSQDAFELNLDQNIQLAEKYWNDEIKGSNAFIQRTRRLIFKVPHYKSGEQLASEVSAAGK